MPRSYVTIAFLSHATKDIKSFFHGDVITIVVGKGKVGHH